MNTFTNRHIMPAEKADIECESILDWMCITAKSALIKKKLKNQNDAKKEISQYGGDTSMKPYDNFSQYTADQWENNKAWIFNRILFLLNLKDKKDDLFHKDYGMDVDKMLKDYKNTLCFELCDISHKYPHIQRSAVKSWVNSWDDGEIKYMEVK